MRHSSHLDRGRNGDLKPVYIGRGGDLKTTVIKYKGEINRSILMITISKEEKRLLMEKLPSVHIRRTMTQKSKRHHYYCEESPAAIALLKEIREGASNNE